MKAIYTKSFPQQKSLKNTLKVNSWGGNVSDRIPMKMIADKLKLNIYETNLNFLLSYVFIVCQKAG